MVKDNTPMWDGQADGVDFACAVHRPKSIFWVDPGLGKTRMYLETYMRRTPGRCVLAIGNKASIPAFLNQSPRWCDHISESDVILISGKYTTPKKRREAIKRIRGQKVVHITPNALKTHFDEIPWHEIGIVVWDECDIIRDHRKVTAEVIARAFRMVEYGVMGTGTLMPRGPQDIFLYLQICDPALFKGYWKYINTFCTVIEGGYGREIIGARNVEGFQKNVLQKYVYRLDANSSDRPPLVREKVMHDMTKEQKRIYNELVEEFMAEVDEEIIIEPNAMAIQHKLRKLLISPVLLGSQSEWGPSFDHLEYIIEEDPHIVVFTPYNIAVDLIAEWMTLQGLIPLKFTGRVKDGETLAEMEKAFHQNRGGKVAAVGTQDFGRGFELPSAKQCHHLGFSYVADKNYQAEKRLSRLTTPHPVTSYYHVFKDTVEEDIVDRLNAATANVNYTMKDFINAIRLRHGSPMQNGSQK